MWHGTAWFRIQILNKISVHFVTLQPWFMSFIQLDETNLNCLASFLYLGQDLDLRHQSWSLYLLFRLLQLIQVMFTCQNLPERFFLVPADKFSPVKSFGGKTHTVHTVNVILKAAALEGGIRSRFLCVVGSTKLKMPTVHHYSRKQHCWCRREERQKPDGIKLLDIQNGLCRLCIKLQLFNSETLQRDQIKQI